MVIRKYMFYFFIFLFFSAKLHAEILFKGSDHGNNEFNHIPIPELQAKANRGDIKAKYLLALHKTQDKQQKEEGIRILEELAATDVLDAAHALYAISKWVDVDSLTPDKALGYLKQSAEGGYDVSQYELAKAYINGAFGKEDLEKSHYWLEKAAEQGNAKAMTYTAYNYYRGLGVPKNDVKAFEWLMKAYNGLGKDFENWKMLGQAYEEGIGTPINLTKAYMCYDQLGTAGIEEKARIAPQMLEEQRAEGLHLSQEWQEKYHSYTMQSLGLKHQKDGSYQ